MDGMAWDKSTQEKFKLLIEKIPVFLRGIAEEKVSKKAQSLAQKENRAEAGEKDLVDAFFCRNTFWFSRPYEGGYGIGGD